MTVNQWIGIVEIGGTVLLIVGRCAVGEKLTWRYAFSFIWPLLLLALILGLMGRAIGGKNWDKPAPRRGHEDDHLCPVCHKGALIPFDELDQRAQAVIDGKSPDIAADCKLFAPIVKNFVRQHRWDKDAHGHE
jgi:hypothetical protein